MKVMIFGQITQSLGGIEIYIRRLVKYLRLNKLDVIVVVEIERSGLYLGSFDNKQKLVFNNTLKMTDLIQLIKTVSIVHIQGYGYLTSLLVFLLAKLQNKKIILTIHGGVQKLDISHFSFIEKTKAYVVSLIRLILGKIVIDNSDVCLSVSKQDLLLRRKNLFCTRKFHNYWLPNAVELGQSNKNIDENRDYHLLFIGRLTLLKGFDKFIKIVNMLKEQVPNLKCLIIGNGNLSYLIDKNDKALIHIEQIPNDIIDHYYSKCKILLITSLTEGFPTTILEAMKNNVAVVASNVGGIPEIITNGINGFTFDLNNLSDANEKIRNLITDHDRWIEIIQKGYETVKKEFNWDIIVKKIIQVYTLVGGD